MYILKIPRIRLSHLCRVHLTIITGLTSEFISFH